MVLLTEMYLKTARTMIMEYALVQMKPTARYLGMIIDNNPTFENLFLERQIQIEFPESTALFHKK